MAPEAGFDLPEIEQHISSNPLNRTMSLRCKYLHFGSNSCGYIRFIFAYTVSMFHAPTSGTHPFVIVCKGCEQNIPAPVETMQDSWIVADCPLCNEKRRYLPADIFRGRLSHETLVKPPRNADRW